jgi:hypothetical protein
MSKRNALRRMLGMMRGRNPGEYTIVVTSN